MTPVQFRKLALSFPGSEERSHQNHPDFRVQGKIFATIGYPDTTRAMVKLNPEQQAEFVHDFPAIFSPAASAWGRQGSTSVYLPSARKAVMQRAVEAAWQNALAAARTRPKGKSRGR